MSFLRDGIIITGVLLLLAFAGLLFSAIMTPANTAIQASSMTNDSKLVVSDFNEFIPKSLDWVILLLFIGLPLIAFGLAFTNYVPSAFFWIAVLLVFVLSVFGGIVQLVWGAVTESGVLSVAATAYPYADFLFSNYMFYILIVVALLGVGTYVKLNNPFAGGGAMP